MKKRLKEKKPKAILTIEEIRTSLLQGEQMPCTISRKEKKEFISKASGSIFGSRSRKNVKPLEEIL